MNRRDPPLSFDSHKFSQRPILWPQRPHKDQKLDSGLDNYSSDLRGLFEEFVGQEHLNSQQFYALTKPLPGTHFKIFFNFKISWGIGGGFYGVC